MMMMSRVTFYYLILLLLILSIPVTFYYYLISLDVASSSSYDIHLLKQSSVVATTSNNITSNSTSFSTILNVNNNQNQTIRRRVKMILFWTSFYQMKDFGFGLGRNPFIQAECRVTNCMTTIDRSLLNEIDAVIFHPVNLDPNDLPAPRMPHQRYVFFFYEAHSMHRSLSTFQNPAINRKFFNWTMTYRRDSDIYGSRYTSIRRRHHQSHVVTSSSLDTFPSTLTPDEFPPDPASFWQFSGVINNNQSQQEKHPIFANRTKSVAWFVSNCNTPSLREIFFHKMAEYITIDVYGECGPLKCIRGGSQNCDKLLNDYKFYIAAENSICPDYITEKFYRALQMGAVPVVYGGGDYSAYAPPHSYINAADFESPQSLAEHLLLLDRNPRLYAKYFDWKTNWQMRENTADSYWCRLCEKLNDDPLEAGRHKINNISLKIYEDMADWFYDRAPCLPGTSVMAKYDLQLN